jgi:hypothetical protein
MMNRQTILVLIVILTTALVVLPLLAMLGMVALLGTEVCCGGMADDAVMKGVADTIGNIAPFSLAWMLLAAVLLLILMVVIVRSVRRV